MTVAHGVLCVACVAFAARTGATQPSALWSAGGLDARPALAFCREAAGLRNISFEHNRCPAGGG
eukprot:14391656-Alexandrium_andersonii.AAC.1